MNEALIFYDEVVGVFKEEEKIEESWNGVSESRWEFMILEGTSVTLKARLVGEGEDELVLVESGIETE